jgi:hypothetical protein
MLFFSSSGEVHSMKSTIFSQMVNVQMGRQNRVNQLVVKSVRLHSYGYKAQFRYAVFY